MTNPNLDSNQIPRQLVLLRDGQDAFEGATFEQLSDKLAEFKPSPAAKIDAILVTADDRLVRVAIANGNAAVTALAANAWERTPGEDAALSALQGGHPQVLISPRAILALGLETESRAEAAPAAVQAKKEISYALVNQDNNERLDLPVGGGRVVIGRAGTPQLFQAQDVDQVSRRHAVMTGTPELCETPGVQFGEMVVRWTIRTSSSAVNETFVNGEQISRRVPTSLKTGDRISFTGQAEVIFRDSADRLPELPQGVRLGNTVQLIGGRVVANSRDLGIFLDKVQDQGDASSAHYVLTDFAHRRVQGQLDQSDPTIAVEKARASAVLASALRELGATEVRIDQDGFPERYSMHPSRMLAGTHRDVEAVIEAARAIAPLATPVIASIKLDSRVPVEVTNSPYAALNASASFQSFTSVMFETSTERPLTIYRAWEFQARHSATTIGFTAPEGSSTYLNAQVMRTIFSTPLTANVTSVVFEKIHSNQNDAFSPIVRPSRYGHDSNVKRVRFADSNLFASPLDRLAEVRLFDAARKIMDRPVNEVVHDEQIVVPRTPLNELLTTPGRLRLEHLEVHNCIVSDSSLGVVAESASAATLQVLRLTDLKVRKDGDLTPSGIVDALDPKRFPALRELVVGFPDSGAPDNEMEWIGAKASLVELWGDRVNFV